ncbi:MAG: PaaI family thioesterase [Ruminococcaceae bacterium]|nr:PaaI family thioesterase [Oscillospiraceae bacterium]
MDKKQAWIRMVEEKSLHYLNLGDGGFDERMKARLVDCDFEAQTVTYAFETQTWQINEKGGIHGGAIAGMFDTAFGVVANFTAGENEATTTDMNISFLRGVDYGMTLYMKVYIVKAGRSLIRQRAELTDAATGKLLATASGSWMPL